MSLIQSVLDIAFKLDFGPNVNSSKFVCDALREAEVDFAPYTDDPWVIEAWAKNHNVIFNNARKRDLPMKGDIYLYSGKTRRPESAGFVLSTIDDKVFLGMHSNDIGEIEVKNCQFVRWMNIQPKLMEIK